MVARRRSNPRRGRYETGLLIRFIYAACLLGATYKHVMILRAHGLYYNYGGEPWLTCAFWTALTFIDPLAVILLFARPKAGLVATTVIIVADVAHNSWSTWRDIGLYGAPHSIGWYLPLIEQGLFMLFVLATVGTAWRTAPRN